MAVFIRYLNIAPVYLSEDNKQNKHLSSLSLYWIIFTLINLRQKKTQLRKITWCFDVRTIEEERWVISQNLTIETQEHKESTFELLNKKVTHPSIL